MSNINKYIGTQIKLRREELGLKQEDIGNHLNLSRVSILNMENGRHGVNNENMFLLCGLFKCTPNDLFPPIKEIKYEIAEKTKLIKKKVKYIKIFK